MCEYLWVFWAFQVVASGKEPAFQCRRCKRWGFDPWVRKIPWRRAWQPTPVILPGESHEQMNLVGYSPIGSRRVRHDWSNLAQHRLIWSEVAQPCLTLWDPMDCSLPCSSVHGIFQARVLEWVAISFSKGSSPPRDQTLISYISHIGRHTLY